MSYSLIVEPAAAREIGDALAYFGSHQYGDAFLGALDAVFDRIAEQPLIYAIVYADVRRALLRSFTYSIFFKLDANSAYVLAVHRQRRDPTRWPR